MSCCCLRAPPTQFSALHCRHTAIEVVLSTSSPPRPVPQRNHHPSQSRSHRRRSLESPAAQNRQKGENEGGAGIASETIQPEGRSRLYTSRASNVACHHQRQNIGISSLIPVSEDEMIRPTNMFAAYKHKGLACISRSERAALTAARQTMRRRGRDG